MTDHYSYPGLRGESSMEHMCCLPTFTRCIVHPGKITNEKCVPNSEQLLVIALSFSPDIPVSSAIKNHKC
jgi:hypothetical protein